MRARTRLPRLLDPESGQPLQSSSEEWANSVSHGIGCLAAIAATPFLIQQALKDGTASRVVGVCIFSATVIFLYLTSTLYHALPLGRAKHRLRIIEHIAIFFLIAGTYTPFMLGVLHGPWGWSLLGVNWGLALAGLLLKIFAGVRYPVGSAILYLVMGWVVLVAARPLWLRMSPEGLFWLFLGGAAYTAGVVFYSIDHRFPYSHFIWHLFVIAGTLCHFLAIYWYAA